jgi:hypothetical protein
VEKGFGGANDKGKSNGNDSGRFGNAFAPAFGREKSHFSFAILRSIDIVPLTTIPA